MSGFDGGGHGDPHGGRDYRLLTFDHGCVFDILIEMRMPEQLTLGALSAPLLISNLEGPYQLDFEQFVAWCKSIGAPWLPSTPSVIASYGKQLIEDGSKPRTILRKLSSISAAHRDASEPLVADNQDAVGRLRKSLRKEIARAERPTLAVVKSGMRIVAEHLDIILSGERARSPYVDTVVYLESLRDKALILIAYAGALKACELESMRIELIEPHEDGALIHVTRDPRDTGSVDRRVVKVFRGTWLPTCPVRALDAWMRRMNATSGPLWRGTLPNGELRTTPLANSRIRGVIDRRLVATGLDPRRLSSHSVRVGSLAQAALAGMSDREILEHGRYHELSFRGIEQLVTHARGERRNAGRYLGL